MVTCGHRGANVRVGRIDVRKTRAFGVENYPVKRVPIAIGVFLLGAFLIVLSRGGDGFGAAEGLFFGSTTLRGTGNSASPGARSGALVWSTSS